MGQQPIQGLWDLPAFSATADALAAYPPYKVPLSRFNVVFHEASIAPARTLQALNGAVVALTTAAAKVESEGGDADGRVAAEAAASDCLGIGIVRSVDPAKQLLYILTSTPMPLLEETTTLEV